MHSMMHCKRSMSSRRFNGANVGVAPGAPDSVSGRKALVRGLKLSALSGLDSACEASSALKFSSSAAAIAAAFAASASASAAACAACAAAAASAERRSSSSPSSSSSCFSLATRSWIHCSKAPKRSSRPSTAAFVALADPGLGTDAFATTTTGFGTATGGGTAAGGGSNGSPTLGCFCAGSTPSARFLGASSTLLSTACSVASTPAKRSRTIREFSFSFAMTVVTCSSMKFMRRSIFSDLPFGKARSSPMPPPEEPPLRASTWALSSSTRCRTRPTAPSAAVAAARAAADEPLSPEAPSPEGTALGAGLILTTSVPSETPSSTSTLFRRPWIWASNSASFWLFSCNRASTILTCDATAELTFSMRSWASLASRRSSSRRLFIPLRNSSFTSVSKACNFASMKDFWSSRSFERT
mmetsp:Transcript_109079/g.243426  ORF Transcript_109079/g.243426 Transcript_109079/m.243426 type:complete len:413 (+) Transcript_109079:909-2147(+)